MNCPLRVLETKNNQSSRVFIVTAELICVGFNIDSFQGFCVAEYKLYIHQNVPASRALPSKSLPALHRDYALCDPKEILLVTFVNWGEKL